MRRPRRLRHDSTHSPHRTEHSGGAGGGGGGVGLRAAPDQELPRRHGRRRHQDWHAPVGGGGGGGGGRGGAAGAGAVGGGPCAGGDERGRTRGLRRPQRHPHTPLPPRHPPHPQPPRGRGHPRLPHPRPPRHAHGGAGAGGAGAGVGAAQGRPPLPPPSHRPPLPRLLRGDDGADGGAGGDAEHAWHRLHPRLRRRRAAGAGAGDEGGGGGGAALPLGGRPLQRVGGDRARQRRAPPRLPDPLPPPPRPLRRPAPAPHAVHGAGGGLPPLRRHRRRLHCKPGADAGGGRGECHPRRRLHRTAPPEKRGDRGHGAGGLVCQGGLRPPRSAPPHQRPPRRRPRGGRGRSARGAGGHALRPRPQAPRAPQDRGGEREDGGGGGGGGAGRGRLSGERRGLCDQHQGLLRHRRPPLLPCLPRRRDPGGGDRGADGGELRGGDARRRRWHRRRLRHLQPARHGGGRQGAPRRRQGQLPLASLLPVSLYPQRNTALRLASGQHVLKNFCHFYHSSAVCALEVKLHCCCTLSP